MLISNLETAYYRRGGQDQVITEEDVRTAFPENRAGGGSGSADTAEYKRVPAELFDALPEIRPLAEEGSLVGSYGYIERTIFFVKTDRGSGTGFLIHPDGYAITCNHVVEGAERIEAILRPGHDGETHPCAVVNRRKDLDMALLKIEDVQDLPYLPMDQRPLSNIRGEEFELWGYPFGSRTARDITNFPGSIASSNDQRDSFGLVRMHIAGEAKQGNSGSPLISKKTGCVIGILMGSITSRGSQLTEEINGMRPIQYFRSAFTTRRKAARQPEAGLTGSEQTLPESEEE